MPPLARVRLIAAAARLRSQHQSRRKDYIDEFWEVVNWLEVAKRFESATTASEQPKPEL